MVFLTPPEHPKNSYKLSMFLIPRNIWNLNLLGLFWVGFIPWRWIPLFGLKLDWGCGGICIDLTATNGSYCWWKNSCTTRHVWNPVNNGIFTISTGAGFLPPTVWIFLVSKSSDLLVAPRTNGSNDRRADSMVAIRSWPQFELVFAMKELCTWQFFVTLLGLLSDPFKG